MQIIVSNKEELKAIINKVTDETAFVIEFEEVEEDEGRGSEEPWS